MTKQKKEKGQTQLGLEYFHCPEAKQTFILCPTSL